MPNYRETGNDVTHMNFKQRSFLPTQSANFSTSSARFFAPKFFDNADDAISDMKVTSTLHEPFEAAILNQNQVKQSI